MLRIQIYNDWEYRWLTVEKVPCDVDRATAIARIHLDTYQTNRARVMDGERRLAMVRK